MTTIGTGWIIEISTYPNTTANTENVMRDQKNRTYMSIERFALVAGSADDGVGRTVRRAWKKKTEKKTKKEGTPAPLGVLLHTVGSYAIAVYVARDGYSETTFIVVVAFDCFLLSFSVFQKDGDVREKSWRHRRRHGALRVYNSRTHCRRRDVKNRFADVVVSRGRSFCSCAVPSTAEGSGVRGAGLSPNRRQLCAGQQHVHYAADTTYLSDAIYAGRENHPRLQVRRSNDGACIERADLSRVIATIDPQRTACAVCTRRICEQEPCRHVRQRRWNIFHDALWCARREDEFGLVMVEADVTF